MTMRKKRVSGAELSAMVMALAEPLRTKVACVVFWDRDGVAGGLSLGMRALVGGYNAEVHEVAPEELSAALVLLGYSAEVALKRVSANFTERERIRKSDARRRQRPRGSRRRKPSPVAAEWMVYS
jgi:hypothetical protein